MFALWVLFFVLLLGVSLVFVFFLLNICLSLREVFLLKRTSFERGFLRVGRIQKRFSIHFFIIILLFVVFDVEVMMLVRLVVVDFSSFLLFWLVLLFVLAGLYVEWFFNKLV